MIPFNLLIFGEGIFVIIYSSSCVGDTIVPFVIVYILLTIQAIGYVVAYFCICFNWREVRNFNLDDIDQDDDDPLIERENTDGLDRDTIDSLPEIKVTPNISVEMCSICLDEFKNARKI